jgi:circadian clock protein KaiC
LRKHLGKGLLSIQQLNPAGVSPGEFVHVVRHSVERENAGLIGIDSLNGYIYAMPEERFLALHIHELLSYLNQQSVITIMLLAQHGLIGNTDVPINLTYVADAILLIRFFEAQGRIRRSISMMKKRGGAHEETLRELRLSSGGIEIGGVLEKFSGILSGVPKFEGEDSRLFGVRT